MVDTDGAFHIGLVQAGAVSAGAYTAGVVDFLIEALDEWEKHKEAQKSKGAPVQVPAHEVKLDVISGASAGAMTAAITAVALHSETDPVRYGHGAPPTAKKNRLYDCWVQQIDFDRLLGTGDLENDSPVLSLLNSKPLEGIARDALDTEPRREPRAWVADPLGVFFTVANLRGVDYGFSLYADGEYRMTNHMDDMRFSIGDKASTKHGMVPLNPILLRNGNLPAEWKRFSDAALASGAFPLGLAARRLTRDEDDYIGCNCDCEDIAAKPRFDHDPCEPCAPYHFVAVDGGLMNNEPLQLVRNYLAGDPQRRNERDGDLADRALILIDPFPNTGSEKSGPKEDQRLLSVLQQMFASLKDQARFHANDLELIARPDVFSRFAISPVRRGTNGAILPKPISAAYLGGFGGFLKKAFREHDFHLGRANCQSFLARHFCLPETNSLFRADRYHHHDVLDRFYVWGEHWRNTRMLPIIPLVGTAAEFVRGPDWTEGLSEAEFDKLEDGIRKRLKAVARRLADTELRIGDAGPLMRATQAIGGLRLVGNLIGGRIADYAVRYVREQVPVVH